MKDDAISRQAAIDAVRSYYDESDEDEREIEERIADLPSAQPEPLTDKEQRIFLAAMSREEKVCKEVDAETTREPYEESLVRVCREIERKVKKALWT